MYLHMKASKFLLCMSCCFAVVYSDKAINGSSSSLPWWESVDAVWTLGGSSQPWLTYNTTKIQVLLSTNSSKCSKQPGSSFPSFHLGFYGDFQGNRLAPTFILAIFMAALEYSDTRPVVVWSANGDHPVHIGATLNLTAERGLVLTDINGDIIWLDSNDELSYYSNFKVRSMNLTCQGNLILSSDKEEIAWQSFDNPTDTWLPLQNLQVGQRLTSRASSHDWETGKYYVTVGNGDCRAFVATYQPIEYGYFYLGEMNNYIVPSYSGNGASYSDYFDTNITYIRLDPNGHVNLYTYRVKEILTASDMLFPSNGITGSCSYPLACGNYGICSNSNACDCPVEDFKPVDASAPEKGCHPITELSCTPHAHKHHTFIELRNVTYFGFDSYMVGISDIDSCKNACLDLCSCKAALFQYTQDLSSGNCSLPSDLLTLTYSNGPYDIAFIKVQRKAESSSLIPKLGSSIPAGLFFIVFCTGVCYYVLVKRRKINNREDKECPPDILINTVARFSFESLRLATMNFQKRLGRGGFGAVFEGTLGDGTKVAVKRLHSSGQTRKEFLAEVNTIGNFHHYNLVRLIGFCDSGSNRLLVYEYMPNGSLDKWIFNQGLAPSLPWSLRQSIIGGIAKGLEYLHENCLQNVIHFDIKPQNILLDEDFNVKISDFGLAKMVDRDQSQVVTLIRGTPGYIAPELITAQVISVKLDVYSFGVLVLEIVCGRKNFGTSSDDLLINLVKIKAEEDRLADLIDERAEDIQQHKEEAVKMMKIAMWCLQPHIIRPSMSMVVKLLQDLANMDALSDLNFLTMFYETTSMDNNQAFSTRPNESILSGPR